MNKLGTVETYLSNQRISRRTFLKTCSVIASLLSLPPSTFSAFSKKLYEAPMPSVIWLSFQECTGCTESLTRSHSPSIEELIFNFISLDYHHTLQAASGDAAENARIESMQKAYGKYLLIVDGSIPIKDNGVYSAIAGKSNLELLQECAQGAAAIIAIGSCASYGGLPAASPNPTGATGVADIMEKGLIDKKSLINIPGCPPLPIAISSVLAHFVAFNRFPELDEMHRPLSFYGHTIHERCSRFHYFKNEKFAEHFDDEGARKGWCLYKLGCKGPTTHNACSLYKWNQGTSSPIESGHPCLGCSEPSFWDKGGFYQSFDEILLTYKVQNENIENQIEEGQNLYEDSCTFCHTAEPSDFKTSPDKIVDLLRSGSIRSHTRLKFSDDQFNILDKYFKSKKTR